MHLILIDKKRITTINKIKEKHPLQRSDINTTTKRHTTNITTP